MSLNLDEMFDLHRINLARDIFSIGNEYNRIKHEFDATFEPTSLKIFTYLVI